MKRSFGSFLIAAMAAGAFAQGNFTIVRPVDGARVREKVRILFPKNSIPSGGYVGIFLNGQLIDAMVPAVHGKYREYILDTKGRGLEDTKAGKPDHLEAKLYVDYNDQPRVVKTSSIDLSIGNEANIKIPNSGLRLRYAFANGSQTIYNLQRRVAEDTISESENTKGGKSAVLPLDTENIRLMYAVDNHYGNGDGLVRVQALPERGKDYAVLTTVQNQQPETFYDYMMAPIYMRLTATGREVFGSIPLYYPMESSTGEGNPVDLFADFPLPSLPDKAVRPGDSWASRFQDGKLDSSKLFEQTSLVKTFPARGEFIRTEWEMGHPCALIKNTIDVAQVSDEDKKLLAKGSSFGGDKVKLSESIWFALDTRKVIKIVRDETLETKVQINGAGGYGGASGGAPGGFPGGPGGGFPGGGPARGGGGGGKGGRGGIDDFTGPGSLNQRGGAPGAPGGYPGGPGGYPGGPGGFPGGPGGFQGGRGGFGAMGGRNGQPSQTQGQYIRLRIQDIFTIER